MATYSFGTTLRGSIGEARPRVEAALKAEGFGILTEIDVAATLKAKLDIDRPPYVILGACNPALANRALEIQPSMGALLPCNVVLRQESDEPETIVEFLDPLTMTELAGEALQAVATEASERLHRVLESVSD